MQAVREDQERASVFFRVRAWYRDGSFAKDVLLEIKYRAGERRLRFDEVDELVRNSPMTAGCDQVFVTADPQVAS